MESNDIFLLRVMSGYCNDVAWAISDFALDEKQIEANPGFRAMIAFFVLQIGETASKLSKEFTELHPEIEWRAIVGFRHRIVHAYGRVDSAILWDTAIDDIPELQEFCEGVLKEVDAASN